MTAADPTGRELERQVRDLLRMLGWRAAHFGPVKVRRRGRSVHMTPVAADGKGFPA